MDTEQNDIFDELEDLHFDFAMERLEKLYKDAFQGDRLAHYLTVEAFMKKQHAQIKELKKGGKELAEQLGKNMEYHNVVVGTYNEAQISSIIEELKCLVENYENNNFDYAVCPRDMDLLETSHKLIETLFEENKILKNDCKKYKQTISKQADKISVLHQSNEMYKSFLSFYKGINFFAFLIAVAAFILSSAAFWSIMK